MSNSALLRGIVRGFSGHPGAATEFLVNGQHLRHCAARWGRRLVLVGLVGLDGVWGIACSAVERQAAPRPPTAESESPSGLGPASRLGAPTQSAATVHSATVHTGTTAVPTALARPPGAGPLRAADFPLHGYELTWSLHSAELGPISVVVWVPARRAPQQRLPVLMALHGRGESRKGPERGARGWFDDYQLSHALQRLASPPLTRKDFQDFVTPARLEQHNQRLAQQPYRPLIVVTPYLPDVLKRAEAFDNTSRLAQLMVDQVLQRVYTETPALGTPETTGIDGVSLGGRAALLIGFSRPQAFATVGALQAAVDEQELGVFTDLARGALQSNPKLQLRLVTSWGDAYLEVNQKLQGRLRRAGIPSELLIVQGTHSYQFNRGPGGLEMLLFHEAQLYADL